MAEGSLDQARSNPPAADRPDERAASETAMPASLPLQERQQPDPALQLSAGRLGAGSVVLLALICAVILGVVLYGLNGPGPNARTASAPPTTSSAPAAGGKSGPAIPKAPQPNNSGHS